MWGNSTKPDYCPVLGPANADWAWFWDSFLFGTYLPCTGAALVQGYNGAVMTRQTGGGTWEKKQKGWAFRADASQEGLELLTPTSIRAGWPVSILIGHYQLGNGSAYGYVGGITHNNTDTNPYHVLSWMADEGFWTIRGNQSGSTWEVYKGAISTGYYDVAVIMNPAGNLRVLLNGSEFHSDATGRSNPTYGATSRIALGNQPGTTGRYSNSDLMYMYILGCTVNLAQHNLIREDPYGPWRMFMPDNLFAVGEPDPDLLNLTGYGLSGGFQELRGGFG